MFPAFVNCTTIDWFSEWPADALLEVAEKYLTDLKIGSDEAVSCLLFMMLPCASAAKNKSNYIAVDVKKKDTLCSDYC